MILLKVAPFFSQMNLRHSRLGNTKSLSDLDLRHTGCAKLAYLNHMLPGKLSVYIHFPSSFFTNASKKASLALTVLHILLIAAKPKVCGIYAYLIVTLVAHIHAIWDMSVSKLVGKPVRPHEFYPIPKLAVTRCVAGCFPLPTIARVAFVNFFPKAFGRRPYRFDSEMMKGNEAIGLPFDMPARGIVYGNNWGLLPTAAMAITVWNFVTVWGMIRHVGISLSDIGRAPDVSSIAGLSRFNYSPNYSTNELKGAIT